MIYVMADNEDLNKETTKGKPDLTTNNGAPQANNENTLTAGPKGPVVMQDFGFMEKQAHFDRERIPERVVHAKGAGAKGYFELDHDLSAYTTADFLTHPEKKTPVLARFSNVAGESGHADTYRDVRGFALRFYTDDGNFDIVGNNTPVFFMNDPLKFPDFIHSQKRDPSTHERSVDMQWAYFSNSPESTHQVFILMTDRGIPYSYRYMHGYGSHTFSWMNAQGEKFWIKYHFKTNQGIKSLNDADAEIMAGKEPDWYIKDLYDAIERGDYPSWDVYVQIIPYEEGINYKHDIFDVTKVVSQHDYPLQKIGKFTLNENPKDYFTEIEEAAFSPANIVPGVGLSPDKLLQGRLFAYGDAARYRLGANYDQIPINKPKNEVHNYDRDGMMQVTSNGSGEVNYEPNSKGGPVQNPRGTQMTYPVSGEVKAYEQDDDYFSAPRALYDILTPDKKAWLIQDIKDSLGAVKSIDTKIRQTKLFYQVDHDFGMQVAEAIGLSAEDIKD